jgi:antitoxin Phd
MSLPIWQTQEAKANFSQLVKAVLEQGDQFITYRGELIAVVISKERYDELTRPVTSLIDFFKNSPLQDVDLEIERKPDLPRDISL